MRVLVLVKNTADSDKKGFVPTPEAKASLEAMGKFNDELRKAGVLVMAEGLRTSSHGKRVAFDGANREVADGPFIAHPEEVDAGFWIWEVKDMDEALAWVKRCPNPMPEPSVIEIRPLATADDLK